MTWYSTYLPVFGDSVPNPDLPGVAGGDQLVTNEEERLGRHVEAEDACGRKACLGHIFLLGFQQTTELVSGFHRVLCLDQSSFS